MSAGTKYDDLIAELEVAKVQAQELIDRLPDSPQKKTLKKNWRLVAIVNISEGNAIPMNSQPPGTRIITINGLTWLDAPAVGKVLTVYHKALKAARLEYHRLFLADPSVNPPVP